MNKANLSDLKKGWETIFDYLFRHKEDVRFLVILGIVSALTNGFVPYVSGLFFDSLLNLQDTTDIIITTLPTWGVILFVWTVLQIISNSVDWISDRKARRIGTFLQSEFTSEAFATLLHLPISFHVNKQFGRVADTIGKASNALSAIIERVIINLAPQILSVLVGIIVSFTINPYLALVLVSGIIFYVLSLIKIIPPIITIQTKAHSAWGDAHSRAYDAIANISTVKQATAEDFEKKLIRKKYVNIAASAWYEVEKIWSDISFYQRIVVMVTLLINFLISVFLMYQGQLTIGQLVALTSYAMIIFGPFVQLGYNWQTIQNGLVAIDKAEKILNTDQEIYKPKKINKLNNLQGSIKFDKVTFAYKQGKKTENVLEEISFEVKPGQIVALVGESGVGKSTLINLLMGYYFPTKGKILIDENNLRNLDLKEFRSQIATVPQEVVLFNETIKENIRYGSFDAKMEKIKEASRLAYADEFIEKFPKKYNQLVGERGIKLSVGQKQRVAIARAILRDPKILILDEPTSALDIQTEKLITESLDKLMEGRTTFIIAHRLSTVRRADKILVFEKGKITQQGKHEDLIKIENGVYKKMHDLHLGLV